MKGGGGGFGGGRPSGRSVERFGDETEGGAGREGKRSFRARDGDSLERREVKLGVDEPPVVKGRGQRGSARSAQDESETTYRVLNILRWKGTVGSAFNTAQRCRQKSPRLVGIMQSQRSGPDSRTATKRFELGKE